MSIKNAVKVMFTQMQATRGFKLFGERAVAAMIKELKQLEEGPMPGKKVVTAINPETLSAEDKAKLGAGLRYSKILEASLNFS